MAKLKTGLIEIYCGEGKGKTTAALGLSLRAHGRGAKVLWTSFLKNYDSGEFVSDMPFDLFKGQVVESFVYLLSDEDRCAIRNEHGERLRKLFEKAHKEQYDILILDELLGALETKSIQLDQVLEELKNKPQNLEVIITGRYVPEALAELADYISCITNQKHPFAKGIGPRIGIES